MKVRICKYRNCGRLIEGRVNKLYCDHMIPVTSAKTEEEIIKRNHYTNLQPLCSKINRDIKKDKLEYEI